MSDPKGEGPPTIRPARVSTPSPDIEIRQSNPDDLVLAKAPEWMRIGLRELSETRAELRRYEEKAIEREKNEQARADARHKDAQNLASAFRSEATEVEQLRKQIQGWRRDIARAFERLDEHEARFDEHRRRIEALERERAGLDAELPTLPPPETDT